MSVEFTEEKLGGENNYTPKKTATMVRWIMKTGLVKDERQANVVLIGIAIIFFLITFIMMTGSSSSKPQPAYLEDIPEDVRKVLPPEILETIPSKL